MEARHEAEAEDPLRKMQRRVTLPLPDGSTATLQQSFLTCETGGSAWDSGLSLCDYMEQWCPVRDLSVLELGSGVGYSAIFAHKLGAKRVVATDGDGDVLRLLRANCAPYAGIEASQAAWGAEMTQTVAEFDLVIGADLIYDKDQHAALQQTVAQANRFVLAVRSRHKWDESSCLSSLSEQMELVRCVKARYLNSRHVLDNRKIKIYEWRAR